MTGGIKPSLYKYCLSNPMKYLRFLNKNLLLNFISICFLSFLLQGCLPSIFAGATGSAMEFAKDRPAGDTLTDIRISTRIKAELAKENFKYIYSRIKLEVVQGRVFFTGLVEKDEHALMPVQIAWQQEGVVDVISEIKVDQSSANFDLVQYTRDTLITSQIKSKIFIDRDIKFVNITVVTIDDVVYLFGIARSEEELQKVAKVAASTRSVKKVVSHIKINAFAKKVRYEDYKDQLVDNDRSLGEYAPKNQSTETSNDIGSSNADIVHLEDDHLAATIYDENADW